jgi:hypothetical protein
MASKVRNLSALIDKQLPNFISTEYPKFTAFLQKYYEQLELPGQPLDLINNLIKYRDIDTYESSILQENTVLTANVSSSSTTITVADTSSFPSTNGYILINDEAIFYRSKTSTTFVDCYRNINATTKLGDLYNKSDIKTVAYENLGEGKVHLSGSAVLNVSNLFLYALVKNFEKEYLGSFPEKDLKTEVDRTLLIKNIKKFYAAKGTDQSIRFIFNSIVAKDPSDIPTVYYPNQSTYKTSNGEWINKYALKVKVLSGDVTKILGEKVVQSQSLSDASIKNAFGVVDNILDVGDGFYEVILATETVVGQFSVTTRTYLTQQLSNTEASGNKINVYSTAGWNNSSGSIIIGNEIIVFKNKNINQFEIESRGQTPLFHTVNTVVYDNSPITATYIDNNGVTQTVKLLVFGILYNLSPSSLNPHSKEGDFIQISDSGFESRNVILFDNVSGSYRWHINENNTSPLSTNSSIQSNLNEVIADVSAIFEDEQYYYITSSGFPSHTIGKNNWNISLSDQKKLKLIRKTPTRTTEIYKTQPNEVGILLNGTTVRSYKDTDENLVVFGEITNVEVTNKGSGYKNTPYVLIQDGAGEIVAEAKAVLSGEVIDRIDVIESGTGFFPPVPEITITSGRGAVVEAIVTGDKVTKLKIINPGEYYSTPPRIIIKDSLGKGRFASYTAVINNSGQLVDFIQNDTGKFYTQQNVSVEVIPVGSGAEAVSIVRSWRRNLVSKHSNNLDDNYGFYFLNNDISLGYGYSYLANPKSLRYELGDNISSLFDEVTPLQHSPIIGYAFDGNPIYGPYGYSNPLNSSSSITRMTSSYSLKLNRNGGPSVETYPLGSFVEDYRYIHRSGSLDENNGRFCVTPEYPEGTYAYFVTITAGNVPVYPYIIGENFYSLPIDSNYNKSISQKDLPKNIRRLITDKTPENGNGVLAYIESINSGSLSGAIVESSTDTFSVGSVVDIDYTGTNGSDAVAQVSSLKGKSVLSIESRQTKALKITTENPAYFFENDIITQEVTGATGQVISNVFEDKTIILRNVSGTFNATNEIYSSINVKNIVLDKPSDFTSNSVVSLTNGKQVVIIKVLSNKLQVASNPFVNGEPIVFSNSFSNIIADQIYYVVESEPTRFKVATTLNGSAITLTNNNSPASVATNQKAKGTILESTTFRNSIKVRVLQGQFDTESGYFLKSSSINDSVGRNIVTIFNLSSDIKPISINDNIAILKTSTDHKIGQGDNITVDIIPNDATTETTIFARKRIYQTVSLNTPIFNKSLSDTGIGNLFTLNNGSYKNGSQIVGDYASSTSGNATFTNVELIFADISKCRDEEGRIVGNSNLATIGKAGNVNNAKATISVTNGVVTNVVLTYKGEQYKRGDLLTVAAASLDKGGTSTRSLLLEVQHVGMGVTNTVLYLSDVNSISQNDYLLVGNEVMKVTSVNTANSFVNVLRGQYNTEIKEHFNGESVTNYLNNYNLPIGYNVGLSDADPTILKYDLETQTITVVYNVSRTLENINELVPNYAFFDDSTPAKLVTVKDNIESASYKFEFSYDGINWERNPILKFQNYYKYKIDTSHFSLRDSFLEFSPSGNFNIITLESKSNNILPGNSGSFITFKSGFGSVIESNQFNTKSSSDFNTFFYFDKNGIIDSDQSYIRVIPDPLQGEKTSIYVTNNEIVYELDSIPQYDGSGSISYTTTSRSAVGEINKVSLLNQGVGFTELPTLLGVRPSADNECVARVVWNSQFKNISSIIIENPGKNYINPKVLLLNSTGQFADFEVVKNSDGSIAGIITKNKGINYTVAPDVKIIETSPKIYFTSSNIGQPKNVEIIFNGKDFIKDSTITRKFTSNKILLLKNIQGVGFRDGEFVVQKENNNIVASGYVSKNGWKVKTNILRLEKIEGEFKNNVSIAGASDNTTAVLVDFFESEFNAEIKSYYDNLGYYASDRSKLSSNYQKIADSYFYQDYSYVIKSKTPIDVWRDLIKQTVHPAGFQLFGEVSIESEAQNRINPIQPKINHISIVELWDPQKNKITVENTYRTITQSSIRISDTNVLRGRGSVVASTYDSGETLSYEFKLTPDFNGYFDANGNRAGTKTFTITLLGSNTPYSVSRKENIVLSLDGIIQEPGVSYTVSGTQLTFSQAPLGYRSVFGDPIPFSQYKEGVDSPPQKIIGRIVRFKDSTLNTQYFRKIKDISSQFDNIKKEFDLYYEDNTPVNLESGENLLVSIDGVVQQSGSTPLLPLDRAYYIRRTVSPNKIVFVESPRVFEGIKQSFHAYSVGSYERLSLDKTYIDGIRKGPFLLKSASSGKTVTVDEDLNVLVFVDGVLQKRNKTYTIRGANITFTEPIKPDQKVNIIYLYGRDYVKSLTSFNYDNIPFLNQYAIVVSGNYTTEPRKIILDSPIKSDYAYGYIKNVTFDGTNSTIIVQTDNRKFALGDTLIITNIADSFYNLTIPASDLISIADYTRDDNSQDVLTKSNIAWLYKTVKDPVRGFLRKDDLIKIDGESDYRKILDIPNVATKTDYRDTDTLGYYGKISTTNYNGTPIGEGLDIVAQVQNGKVVSLIWNQKDWNTYETKKILPSSPGYGYETAPQLVFVSQPLKDEGGTIIAPAQGGGAKAYAVVHDGEIVDIILYDQGSEYIAPPRVFVARGYDVLRKGRSVETNNIFVGMSPQLELGNTLYVSTGDRLDADIPPQVFISSFLLVTPFDSDRKITAIIQRSASVKTPSSQAPIQHISRLDIGVLDVTSLSASTVLVYSSLETPLEIVSTQNNVTIQQSERYLESSVRTFAKINYLLVYKSLHETGAYLDSPMDLDDTIAFIGTTAKFANFGKLLIGDEIVSYNQKLSDRFLYITRGENGTTIKNHPAGEFLRQFADDVSIIDAGVSSAESIAQIQVVGGGVSTTSIGIVEILQIESNISDLSVENRLTEILQIVDDVDSIQSITSENINIIKLDFTVSFVSDNISLFHQNILETGINNISVSTIQQIIPSVEKFYKTGFIDYYIETILFTNPILQRNGNTVVLEYPENQVYQRNSNIVLVNNSLEDYPEQYSSYTLGNIGNNLYMTNNWYTLDDGTSNVSGLTFDEIIINYNQFTIEDFTEKNLSSISKSRFVWNLTYPSIQNPVTISSSNGNIGSTINVQNATNFPSSGYFYHTNGTSYGVIQYTGKTATTFTGCTVYSGSTTITNTSQIIPYSI